MLRLVPVLVLAGCALGETRRAPSLPGNHIIPATTLDRQDPSIDTSKNAVISTSQTGSVPVCSGAVIATELGAAVMDMVFRKPGR